MYIFNIIETNSDGGGAKYPMFLNLRVLQVVDFWNGLANVISIAASLVKLNSPECREKNDHTYCTASESLVVLVFFWAVLDKISQIFRMPSWKGHRALAYRIFGPVFLPVASTARRSQESFILIETLIFTFPPLSDYIFINVLGTDMKSSIENQILIKVCRPI